MKARTGCPKRTRRESEPSGPSGPHNVSRTPARLTYVTDTYCVWCWAFGDALRQFVHEQGGDVELEVLPAGMLMAERVVPVGENPACWRGPPA